MPDTSSPLLSADDNRTPGVVRTPLAQRLRTEIQKWVVYTQDRRKQFSFSGRRPDPETSKADGNDTTERTLIENIADLGTWTAEEIMVPRVDILAIEVSATADDFMNLIKTTPHSRIPVYQDTLDDMLGFIHIKDVLRVMAQGETVSLRDILRPAMIVSPAMPALDLLVAMRQHKRHLALVVDEYGGIDGLVTLGDLLEAIVGELRDEHNTAASQPRLFERLDGTVIVDARYGIDDFEKIYGEIFIENEREEADTMGGLAMFLAGRMPQRGELLTHSSGVQIEIIDADPRRLKRLRIRNMPLIEKTPSAA